MEKTAPRYLQGVWIPCDLNGFFRARGSFTDKIPIKRRLPLSYSRDFCTIR